MLESEIFALVMEHDPNLVFVKDENSIILFANRAFLEFVPPERHSSVVGGSLADHRPLAEAELWLSQDRRAFDEGRSEIVETVVDNAGRRRTLVTRKIAFDAADGKRRLLGISTDITELSQRERALIATSDRLKRFGAFAAHDLRSPLGTFVTAMNMIKADRDTTLSPQAGEYLDLMIASATHLAANVTALLEVARDEETTAVNLRQNDMNLLIEEVRFNLSSLVDKSGATIYTPRLPSIVCEAGLVRQLFQNLVENSIKNRRDDEPLHVLIRYERSGQSHRFFVEDNGRGVSDETAETMFDAFEQGGRDRAKRASTDAGVGLGLALCRRIVDIHAGAICVDRGFESGCRIEIMLPVDPAAERQTRQAHRAA